MSDKAIFLDRDDTLIKDPGYINKPEQVELLDGVAEALIEFRGMGYKLVVITNQSGVARGIVSVKTLEKIHERLKQLLSKKGAYLDKIYFCPYHPEGTVEQYSMESELRKPEPGMLLAAAEEMGIKLSQSWMLGNSVRDIEAGLRAGCKTILLDNPTHDKKPSPGEAQPDYTAVNMKEVINIIKQHERSSKRQASPMPPSVEKLIQPEPIVQAPMAQAPVEQPIIEVPKKKVIQETEVSGGMNEHLLRSILEQLRRMHRTEMFGEFSVLRLIAGIIQIGVVLCLLISIWLLISSTKQVSSVLITLGYACVLQLMALSFYIMQGRK